MPSLASAFLYQLCLQADLSLGTRQSYSLYFQCVLVFYYCVTNYSKLSGFKHLFISSQLVMQVINLGGLNCIFCSRSHKTENEALATIGSYLEVLEKSLCPRSFSPFSLVPCGHMTPLVPVSLLVIVWGQLSAFRG